MANCVAHCVGIILSDLQYRFSSCSGCDIDIYHEDGDVWLKCWDREYIDLACDMEMYL